MTETTEIDLRYIVDPVAFFLALLGGPILFTLATCWLALIPVFALLLGGIPYLVLGTPILLIHLRRNAAATGRIAALALFSFLGGWGVLLGLQTLQPSHSMTSPLLWILPFGIVFAPCWGASFGWLYIRLARTFYTRGRPL